MFSASTRETCNASRRHRRVPVKLDADQLFRFSREYASRHELDGHGTVYPTLAIAAEHFKCSMKRIEEVCGESTLLGYLGLAVAHGRPGFGWGNIDRKADWLIEAYE